MQINELPSASSLAGTDVMPLDKSTGTTYKTKISDMITKFATTTIGSTLFTWSNTAYTNIKAAFGAVQTAVNDFSEAIVTLQQRTAYAANESQQVGTAAHRIVMNGFLTASMQTIYLTINTSKLMTDVTNVRVTAMVGRIRGVQGILDNATADTDFYSNSNYTLTAVICSDNSVTVTISRDTAWSNAVNNTPVNFHGYITLFFT